MPSLTMRTDLTTAALGGALLLAACTPSELSAVRDSVVASFETRAGGPGRPFVLDASCHALVATKG